MAAGNNRENDFDSRPAKASQLHTPELLSFSGVSFRYSQGQKAALEEVDIRIDSGSSTAVLGPNGAGKSTLLDLCLGWKHPHRGDITLAGRKIEDYGRREMGTWMSLVPQNERVRFEYTVLEYLILGRTPYLNQLQLPQREDMKIVEEALETVGLNELAERSVGKLSGGEHQLLLIARALVQQPRILILDEPTSQLDPANRRRIENLLMRLNGEGKTLLFTTHDPRQAAEMGSHAVLLKEGEVLAAGENESILTGENLSRLYDIPMKVVHVEGRTVIV